MDGKPPPMSVRRRIALGLREPLLWLIVLATACQLLYPLDHVSMGFGDAHRYAYQAEHLATEGEFVRHPWAPLPEPHVDLPETGLPPLYPLFLASMRLLAGSPHETPMVLVRVVQAVMAILAAAFLYLAISPNSRLLALLAGAALASFPGLTLSAAAMRSEILTVFLGSASVLLLCRQARGADFPGSGLLLGVLLTALILCAPGMALVCLPVGLYLLWALRHRRLTIAWILLGGVLALIPWQIHTVRATGRPLWTIYSPLPFSSSNVLRWLRTWSRSEENFWVIWRGSKIDPTKVPDLPTLPREERDWALAALTEGLEDREARERADYDPALAGAGHDSRTQPFLRPDLEAAFGREADRRRANAPWDYVLWLPLARAAALWGSRVRDADGRLMLDAIRENLTLLLLLTSVLFGTMQSLRRRKEMYALAMLLTLVAYTVVSAYVGLGEERRNITLFPFLLATLAFVDLRRSRAGPPDPRESLGR